MADVWGNTRMFGLKMADAPSPPSGNVNFTDGVTAPTFGIGTVSDTKYYTAIQGLFAGAQTAMIDAFFYADQKVSVILNSDLQSGSLISVKTNKKHWTGVGTFNTT